MLIGLTGQIGGGKSTAADILKSFGAAVVDADWIGHLVVKESPPLRRKLAAAFGDDIFTARGVLNRKKLAGRAFADAAAKRRLDSLVHPYLLRELHRQVHRESRGHRVVVIDAALLLDWRLDRECDVVLVIHASKAERLRRLEARGISRADSLARLKAQLPWREYQLRSDRVILNNQSIAALRRKLRRLWRQIALESR